MTPPRHRFECRGLNRTAMSACVLCVQAHGTCKEMQRALCGRCLQIQPTCKQIVNTNIRFAAQQFTEDTPQRAVQKKKCAPVPSRDGF